MTASTAIVTGAARGIGAGVAKRLAADGLSVAVLDLDAASCKPVVEQIGAGGGRAIDIGVDVSNEEAAAAAVARIADELGNPGVLVNNAGIIRDNLLLKMTVDDWDAVINVHLRGSFLMTRAVQGYMTTERRGRIVNLSSTSALGNRGQVNYSAAKAGIQGFTKTLALELGKFGVTANAIAPGFIETEMTAATAARMNIPFDEFKAYAAKDIPVGRVGTPADIAHTVSFFASENAGFVSGQVIYVAGGPKAWDPPRVFRGIAELEATVGEHLGYSDWIIIAQQQIDTFADVTGEHQWVQVDPAPARVTSYFAHGVSATGSFVDAFGRKSDSN